MSIFSLVELSSVAIKISAWINSAGLNNLGRPKFEFIGSAYEKFGDWTGPNKPRQREHLNSDRFTFITCFTLFLYTSLPLLLDYDYIKMPNFTFHSEDVNKRRQNVLSLSKIWVQPREINSRETCPHQTFSANLKERWFILKVTFLLPSPSPMLKDSKRG